MNNKQNLEKAQAALQMIERCNNYLLDYTYKRETNKWYDERYYTVSRIQARLKNYYNNTIDKLTKFNG